MEFELITSTCVFSSLSRNTFLEMLLGTIKIDRDFTTFNSADAFTGKYKRYWQFKDLDIDFIAITNSLEEIEDFMKEIEK